MKKEHEKKHEEKKGMAKKEMGMGGKMGKMKHSAKGLDGPHHGGMKK